MRRGNCRMSSVVPCTSKAVSRTESRKDIIEIVKTKLATIKEEPEQAEMCELKRTPVRVNLQVAKSTVKKKKKKKKSSINKGKNRRCSVPRFGLKESYALFMAAGFASKGSSIG
ncbi:hypothetical protein P3X46_005622 [Hevea brasiliensis]|uniref:Uncharacterized protein n=1 Tax=Hevea brasiliensis TaxID=3981 RepID=A0ABQ9N350_HEVBR|nr:hypothetical protein P3X46_005622 [Hevea brasiliensis]